MKSKFNVLAFIGLLISLQSCVDNAIVDNFFAIPNQHWTYAQPIKTAVEINNTSKKYNVFINLRHTYAYKYANIWFKVSIVNPDKTKQTERIEFNLASPDGAWLGTTAGNLFTCQLPYKQNFSFALKGKYLIVVEQNMRDNPLDGVNDLGLRVEQVE